MIDKVVFVLNKVVKFMLDKVEIIVNEIEELNLEYIKY